MKIRLTLVFTVLGIYATICVHAQVNDKLYGEKADFITMATRILIVELQEEDPEVIKSITYAMLIRKEKKDSLLKEYKSFISNYNIRIKSAVEKYWKYNESVEFKTSLEVSRLKETKNTKYVHLSYILLEQTGLNAAINNAPINHLGVPALIYSRMEQPEKKPDYKICIPSTGTLNFKNLDYLECDFKFTLTQMQEHLKWMIQNNKTIEFQEYAGIKAKENCSKLKNLKLQIQKNLLRNYLRSEVVEGDQETYGDDKRKRILAQAKEEETKAKEAYGKEIDFVTAGKLDSSYTANKQGIAIVLRIPYQIMNTPSGSTNTNAAGVARKNTELQYYKVVVDCETNKILWTDVPQGFKAALVFPDAFLSKSDFKNMGLCK